MITVNAIVILIKNSLLSHYCISFIASLLSWTIFFIKAEIIISIFIANETWRQIIESIHCFYQVILINVFFFFFIQVCLFIFHQYEYIVLLETVFAHQLFPATDCRPFIILANNKISHEFEGFFFLCEK